MALRLLNAMPGSSFEDLPFGKHVNRSMPKP